MEYVFYSDLSMNESVVRFGNAIGRDRGWFFEEVDLTHPIVGRLYEGELTLRKREDGMGNMPFNRTFYGKISSDGKATKIQGHFAVPNTIKAMFALWYLGLFACACLTFGSVIFQLIGGTIKIGDLYGLTIGPYRSFSEECAMNLIFLLVPLPLLLPSLDEENEKPVIKFIEDAFHASPVISKQES